MKSPLQQEKDGFNTSKKDNERYAACPAPQEVKDSGTGLVGQVVKFQRRFKWHNSCAHTGIYRVCDFEILLVSTFQTWYHMHQIKAASLLQCEETNNDHGQKEEWKKWRKAVAEDEAAENLSVCSLLDLTTVSKQTWIMLHHNCAENALELHCAEGRHAME